MFKNKNNNTLYIKRRDIVKYDFVPRRQSYRIEVRKQNGISFTLILLPDKKKFFVEYGEAETGKVLGKNNKVLATYEERGKGILITFKGGK